MTATLPFPDIGPDLFSVTVFGMTLALRWYALAYIVGIVIGWRLIVVLVQRPALWPAGGAPMRPAQVEELLTWVILGIILGGRLGFVLFYRPVYYLQNPLEIPMIWQGGMAFHGGLLGVVIAVWIFCARNGIDKLKAADCLAIAAPAGLFLGRCANFINAELWGRPWDGPWAFVFPTDPLQVPRHPSQLYEAVLEGALLGALLLWLALRRGGFKTPGLIAGLFFAGYGGGRFVVEFFRQADAQFITDANPNGFVIGAGLIGVTMGQLLSLPMLLLGLGLVAYAVRRARHAAAT
ncbi:MAG: prolipoprotein diacylglyceryl transferase [Pseudomonadota bacterium]